METRRAVESPTEAMEKGHPLAQALLAKFLERYLEDQASDAVRSLEEYRGLFPRIADLLEEEYQALRLPPIEGPSSQANTTRACVAAPIARDIRERIRMDRAAGLEPTLAEYLNRFPSREREVADAVAHLAEGSAPNGFAAGDSVPMPSHLGGYEILRELGRGGQATVYLGQDPKLGRPVALKVFVASTHLPTSTARMRFEREAFTAARLDHPNLCAIYEVGQEDQVAFIAMRYVPGEPLSQRIARVREIPSSGPPRIPPLLTAPEKEPSSTTESRSTRARLTATLRMVEDLARAVHVAHEAGILHRDIKPSNVMLTPEGSPVLLDFGLALSGEDESLPSLTRTGDQIGTPRYMSPEQVRADGRPLDRRTDVYSLGVTLFECLTGRCPFEQPSIQGLYKAILDRDPPRAHRLVREIPEDLSIVLEVALEKDPERRYATALELAEDLRRVIDHQPILARSASAVYQAKKFAHRHRGLVAGAIAALVASTIGTVVATWFGLEARSMARLAAEREAEGTQIAYRALYDTSMRALVAGDHVTASAAAASLPDAPGGWETRHLEAYLGGPGFQLDTGLRWGTIPMGFVEGDVPITVVNRNGEGVLIDILSGESLAQLGPAAIRYWLQASPARIIAEWSSEMGLFDLGGTELGRFSFPEETMGVFADATDDTLVVLTADGVFGFDVTSRERLYLRWPVSWKHGTTPPEGRRNAKWSSGLAVGNGDQVAFVSSDRSTTYLELIEARTGNLIREADIGDIGVVNALRTAPGGDTVTALTGSGVFNFTLPELERTQPVSGYPMYASIDRGYRGSLRYRENGNLLLVTHMHEGVHAFDTATWDLQYKALAPFKASQAEVSPSGEWLLLGEITPERQRLQLKRKATAPVRVLDAHEHYVYAAAFHPEGRLLATGDYRGNVLVWDPLDGSLIARWSTDHPTSSITELWFSSDGGWLVARGDESFDGPLTAWDLTTGLRHSIPNRDDAACPSPPPGAILDSGAGWNVEPHRALAVGPSHDIWIEGGESSGKLTATDKKSGRELVVELAHPGGIGSVTASMDGRWIASGGTEDGKARVWSWPDGELVATLEGTKKGAVHTVAFHPDSSRLVTGGVDGILRIWDTRNFKLARESDGHQDYIHCAVFSPDGTMLVTTSGDRTVRIWDTVPSYHRADSVASAAAHREELRRALELDWESNDEKNAAAKILQRSSKLSAEDLGAYRRIVLAD